MSSQNFEFLQNNWPELAMLAGFAEQYAYRDTSSAVTKLRNFAERTVNIVYTELNLPKPPQAAFMVLLNSGTFEAVTPKVVIDKLHVLRIHGNKGAHGDTVSDKTALWLIREAYDIGRWLWATYANGNIQNLRDYAEPPKPSLEPGGHTTATSTLKKQIEANEARMQALFEELAAERAKNAELQKTAEELEQLKQSISNKGQKAAKELHFNEANTRKYLIDLQLAEVGWQLDRTDQVTIEEKILHQPTTSGEGYADYVLWDENGKPLAVIEAKKTSADAERGRHQAKIYANGLEKMHGQRPVIFYTNGHDIWIWDDHPQQNYPPRKLYGYYSRTSLQYLVRQRSERKAFATVSPKLDILGDRLYQHEALKRITERFETGQRKALAVQATGTGKTRLAIALSDVCKKAGWVKRVLFVCDRRELRKQAKNTFSEYLSEPITILNSKSVQDTQNRIFFATYPGMMELFDRFDPGFFDLIIADESHRSIYNVYGDIFRYFDALQLGLTATPVEMVSRSTCQLFGCDFKEPTCNYTLETAVDEGYLVPYQVVKHTTKFLREGIKGRAFTPEQIAQLEDQGKDPNMLDFAASQIDNAIFNKDTNRKILINLMEKGIRQADGQTLGKTIIFARNHKHAKLLEQLFDELYPQYGGKFCQVIDNYDPRAEELIDDFKGQGSNPELTIAISVDMLDTGIDVPEIVNLVFARPVRSPVKFWQMIGRGTRLCLNLFGPGRHKTHFLVFDHWGVVEYHGVKPREVEITQVKSLMQRLFEARLTVAETALKHAETDFFETLADWLHATINSLDDKTIAVRDKWRVRQQLGQIEVLKQFSANTVTLLRSEMAPLMQWLDVRGHSDAYQWDLLITRIQQEKITGSTFFNDCVNEAIKQLWQLQMNLNQVKAKAELIKKCRELSWWNSATLMEMEQARVELRGIMEYRTKSKEGGAEVLVIDVTDTQEVTENQKTYLNAVDMAAYRVKVETALKELFEQDPVLLKIRNGEAVSPAELDLLNSLIHTRHPDVDLHVLKTFYDTAAPLDQILRAIVGMDVDRVNQRFASFIQQYTSLSARQVQFLNLLKRHIARSGAIEINKLYEMPFSALGEPDTLFSDGRQIDDIIAIVESFGKQPAPAAPPSTPDSTSA